MSRKLPEKRIYNINLYLNTCILFKSFKSELTPKNEYKLYIKHHPGLIDESSSSSISLERIPGDRYDDYQKSYEYLKLVFGNQFYNKAHDTFEYFLIRKE